MIRRMVTTRYGRVLLRDIPTVKTTFVAYKLRHYSAQHASDTFQRLNIQLPKETNNSRSDFISRFSTTEIRHRHVELLALSHEITELNTFYTQIKKYRLPIPNHTYLALLKAVSKSGSSIAPKIATDVFYEVMNKYKVSKKLVVPLSERNKVDISLDLLKSFKNCSDYSYLLVLNLLWENYIRDLPDPSGIVEVTYHQAYTNILLNSGELEVAKEYLESVLDQSPAQLRRILIVYLPLANFIHELQQVRDCDAINQWINIILEAEAREKNPKKESIITPSLWIKLLDIGLLENNYPLVRSVYDNYIMKGFDNSTVTTEEAIFHDFTSKNKVFGTLNDKTIFQILHTLSTNGDVSSTLALIETHFLHKSAKGEKALSKDLCIKIIESYCYHADLENSWPTDVIPSKTEKDQSIKKVLDVLNGFTTKFIQDRERLDILSYKDITSAMSVKFWDYYSHDEHIQNARTKSSIIAESIQESEENIWDTMVLPRKQSNQNVHKSHFGNMLANMNILREFVSDHINYLTETPKIQNMTITLFINCLLNHIKLHQNFSATVCVLSILHNKNANFISDWLDSESFDIILNTLSLSSAAKISSNILYKYLKLNSRPVTPRNYKCFISANLRGDVNNGLQFYLYNYLKDYKGVIGPEIEQILKELPMQDLNENTMKLINACHSTKTLDPDVIWDTYRLSKTLEESNEEQGTYSRKYHKNFDIRDSGYLRTTLGL